MAEALGIAEAAEAEEKKEENIFVPEAPEEIEGLEPERQAAAEKPQLPHFHDTASHFEGMVIFGDGGNVIDYVGNFGSMRAACEANPAGAPVEKVLGLYQEVINKDGAAVEKRFPDPENASVTIVHTLTRVGYDRIVISITREKAQAEVEKNSQALSPVELSQRALLDAAWKTAATPVETFHGEPAHAERAEKVFSIETVRTVRSARQSGITLEGLPVESAAAPENQPAQESRPSAAQTYLRTASLEEVLQFNGEIAEKNERAGASAPAQELEALQFLRAA